MLRRAVLAPWQPEPRTARSIETLSTRASSGRSMPRKKMSLHPLWLRSIRTGVASCRMGNGSPGARFSKFGAHAQRIIGRMPGAKHPLIAAHQSERSAAPGRPGSGRRVRDTQPPARSKVRRSVHAWFSRPEKQRWPLRSGGSAISRSRQTGSGVPADRTSTVLRQMKAMNRIKKEQSTNPFVKIVAVVPEPFEFRCLGLQLSRASTPAECSRVSGYGLQDQSR